MTRPTLELAALLASFALAACGPGPGGDAASSDSGGEAGAAQVETCTLEEVERGPLVWRDDVSVYVEPASLIATPEGFILVGQPTYEWSFDARGRSLMESARGFFGVEVRDGEVGTIAFPPGVGDVGWVSATPIESGRIGVLIEEVEGTDPAETRTTRVLYAEFTDGLWTPVEDVPLPAEGRVIWSTESSIGSTADGRVYWATPYDRLQGGHDVLVSERGPSGWHTSVVTRRWADEAAMVVDTAGVARVVVTGLDPIRGEGLRSARLVRRDAAPGATWSAPRPLETGEPGQALQAPTFVRTGVGLDLAWIRTPALEGPSELRVLHDADAPGESGPTVLDPDVLMVRRVDAGPGPAYLLSLHTGSLPGTQALRVHARGPNGYVLVASLPYPFQGLFAAATTATGDLIIIGPEASMDPVSPFVRSLVIRLSSSCT